MENTEVVKHAFLIIAHNEFGILQRLLDALDDERIDFYVHIDKKVKELPVLHTEKSGLFMVKNRIDTRWGDVSQIKTELSLFKEAYHPGEYCFYHLISGVHYPLKPVDEILAFYESHIGKAILDRFGKDAPNQEEIKIHRYNFFTRGYAYGHCKKLSQKLWRLTNELQGKLKIRRHKSMDSYKASNWLSLPEDILKFIIDYEDKIISDYRFTFCGDEHFIPTQLMVSIFKTKIFKADNILYQIFGKANPRVLDREDFDDIKKSNCLFARKFSSKDSTIIDLISQSVIKAKIQA